jgi:hypothetical protein
MTKQNIAIETLKISLHGEPNRIGSQWKSVEPLQTSKYAGFPVQWAVTE